MTIPDLKLALVLACTVVTPGLANDASEVTSLSFGYSIKTLMGVNANDAEAAIHVFAKALARQRNLAAELESTLFTDVANIDSALLSGAMDVVVLGSRDYLALSQRVPIEPVFVPVRSDSAHEQLVLLVRRERADAFLDELPAERILISVSQQNELPQLWLDTVLRRDGVAGGTEGSGVQHADRASKAILPVFFGQVGACVVLRSAYNTVVALNPQVGEQLVALRESAPLVMSVVCLSPAVTSAEREVIEDMITRLPESTEGRQLLDIFQITGHVRYSPDQMAGVEALVTGQEGGVPR